MTLYIYIPQTNNLTKNQLNTRNSFQDIAQTRYNRSRLLLQDQMLNQGHAMILYT